MRLLPRRFPPTREGWWFLVATLLVGAAAINGGINLMFLVFGMMLFLIIASGILSEMCLRDLTVARREPSSIHAGAPYLMGMSVRNDKKRIPTFSLEVEDLIDGKPVDRRCYYLKLPALRMQETAYRHVLPRRGYHVLSGYRISTRFPFGLIRKSRDVDAPAQLLVYPALVPVPEGLIPKGMDAAGRRQNAKPSRGGDFAGLREWRSGDDPRDIHWRTSARRGRPFVREFEDESTRTAVVVLDDGDFAADTSRERFEAAVSLAASIAIALLKQGFRVGLEAGGAFIPPADGGGHTAQLLKCLALVAPGAAAATAGSGAATKTATRFHVSPGHPAARVGVTSPGSARRSA